MDLLSVLPFVPAAVIIFGGRRFGLMAVVSVATIIAGFAFVRVPECQPMGCANGIMIGIAWFFGFVLAVVSAFAKGIIYDIIDGRRSRAGPVEPVRNAPRPASSPKKNKEPQMPELKRLPFIAHISAGLRPLDDGGFADMGGQGSPVGRAQGLTRIGIHYEVQPPGSRSSFPHAERDEDEFVLVLGGRPDVWIDGVLYPLEVGDSVAFPAGTGIAHAFLNNSDEDMHLLVVGEASKPGAQINYPLNPERNAAKGDAWWSDAPQRPLDPHDGKAVAGSRGDRPIDRASRPPFIARFSDRMQKVTNPSFANFGGYRSALGADGGLTRLGIHHDELPPGNRTSHPHAESREDEFVLVLAGRPDVWIDGHLYPLDEGDGVAFPAGTGIAHSFLNNSDEDVYLLVIGQHGVPGNQLIYPLNPARNAEFRQWGEFWEDAPKRELGPHDGIARAGTRK